eukprot:m.10209 g.10209  ORF g.10209 m.10209 type:complete len:231 (-) comp5565_c0_seq1:29-721(-)
MALLAELEARRQALRPTETVVRTLGFVADLKPDPNVAVFTSADLADGLPGALLLGSRDAADSEEILEKHGVTHVLNVAAGIAPAFPERFKYLSITILDLPETNIVDYFEKSFSFLDAARSVGAVLVHCNAGVSRSASIVAGYLITKMRQPYTTVLAEMKRRRPAVRPNDGFDKQLRAFSARIVPPAAESQPDPTSARATEPNPAEPLCVGGPPPPPPTPPPPSFTAHKAH